MLGTALPVRLATTPPPIPPITCPDAQAMLETPGGEALVQAARLGDVGDQGQRRREAEPGAERGEDQRRRGRAPRVAASAIAIIATAQIESPTT